MTRLRADLGLSPGDKDSRHENLLRTCREMTLNLGSVLPLSSPLISLSLKVLAC